MPSTISGPGSPGHVPGFQPSHQSPARARTGTRRLFRELIEPLGDSFLARDRRLQQQWMARIISRVRQLPGALSFHETLDRMGLGDEDALLARTRRLNRREIPALPRRVERVLVPSRVTLGADVLLTGVIVRTCLAAFPGAEVVFLGSRKNAGLIAGDSSRFRTRPHSYPRRGSLLDRLSTWVEIAECRARGNPRPGGRPGLRRRQPRFQVSSERTSCPCFPSGGKRSATSAGILRFRSRDRRRRANWRICSDGCAEMFRAHARGSFAGSGAAPRGAGAGLGRRDVAIPEAGPGARSWWA